MRIGIDVRVLSFGETGFSRYINNLLTNLREIDNENTYILYLNDPQEISAIEGAKNFRIKVIKGPFLIYKYLLLPFHLLKDKVDIFHSMTHDLPFLVFCKKVVTFYDLNIELLPNLYEFKLRMLSFLKISKLSAHFADKIISISENTKKDLTRLYKVSADKIKVIHLAADRDFFLRDKEHVRKNIAKKFGIDFPFILYVGQIRVQKNLPRMLEAFKKIKEKGIPQKLVLVGANNRGSEFYDLKSEARRIGLANEVIHISNCQRTEDLAYFYNSADLFVYPSLYEGFGLPVLEAFACGAAVIASYASSIPEVAGDAGILVDPYDIDALARAMLKVLSDDKSRNELVSRGLERVKCFSWLKAAQETLAVYQSFEKTKIS